MMAQLFLLTGLKVAQFKPLKAPLLIGDNDLLTVFNSIFGPIFNLRYPYRPPCGVLEKQKPILGTSTTKIISTLYDVLQPWFTFYYQSSVVLVCSGSLHMHGSS